MPNPRAENRYKLIKANSYSFPERIEISESGKRLIRKILQSNPEMRPTIDEVLNPTPFTKPYTLH